MFDHKNFATGGFFPGRVTARSIANLGSYEIEVTIEPVQPSRGGGGGADYRPLKKDKYKIRIRISSKKKVWEYETITNSITARVVAKLSGITLNVAEVQVKSVTVSQEITPIIKVDKK